ncbi:MAG TPA: transporter [Candidatus Saccharimonadales bacterium]|nr:transporter [Candidatus Saccharimonadales bacterium]
MIKRVAFASAIGAAALGAGAQETNGIPPDKSGYNLFNPTPTALMRELSPDRPDETESAYTVDAGHYQLEMDFVNFTYDQSDGTTTKAWEIGDFNFKVGLLNNADLQLVYDNYLNVRTTDSAGNTTTQSGFGDFTTRLKVNLWGDDSGETAFALLPYVTFPTSTDNLENNAVEGGMIFPLAVNLPYDFDLSLETAASLMKNADNGGYHEEFIASASLDHQIIGKLSGFVEFFSNFTTESHAGWVGTVDTGLEYLVTKNIQLDCDCYFGVTPAAPDYNPFCGITVRF